MLCISPSPATYTQMHTHISQTHTCICAHTLPPEQLCVLSLGRFSPFMLLDMLDMFSLFVVKFYGIVFLFIIWNFFTLFSVTFILFLFCFVVYTLLLVCP